LTTTSQSCLISDKNKIVPEGPTRYCNDVYSTVSHCSDINSP